MQVDISTEHNEYRLQGTINHLQLGPANAKLLILSGTKPSPGGALTTVLAEFILDEPPGTITAGVLELTADPVMVDNSGTPTWARLVNGDGNWNTDFDAGGPGSGCAVIVSGSPLFAGGEVALVSALLG